MKSNFLARTKRKSLKCAVILLILLLCIVLLYFTLFKTVYNIKYKKVVFNEDITDYEIQNSSLIEILSYHPIEAFRNCIKWNYPNEDKYIRVNGSNLYSCSILKYDNKIYIIEIWKK